VHSERTKEFKKMKSCFKTNEINVCKTKGGYSKT